ncbi:MAG: putative membrane protein YphA (DoxX/SURF4 family) [Hyphomicrobiaceae bacterium]|jgi:uncharacterized membrane protein YphA (DoxX/SURF4 family)
MFLGGLGVCYGCAFFSLGGQIAALYGPEGILPIADVLNHYDQLSFVPKWRQFPTVLWWTGAEAGTLQLVCGLGVLGSLGLVVGLAPKWCAFGCWALYLSLVSVSRVFLNFQWDILLLEAGFLGLLWAPPGLRPKAANAAPASRLGLWLVRWLLFRLMFASGVVKLASADPTWWQLTALAHHFETQPLPVWMAWYAHHLPAWLGQLATASMFVIELVVPFAIFAPRVGRLAALVPLVLLQLAIMATGNYAFFNLLTLALCATLLDDDALRNGWHQIGQFVGRRSSEVKVEQLPKFSAPGDIHTTLESVMFFRRSWRGAVVCGAILLALAGGAHMWARLCGTRSLPPGAGQLIAWTAPWRLAASYGLFANMTEVRREIVLEGSLDGRTWRRYEFRWKPGDPSRRPGFVQPHQPRLDWQMWFAALSSPQRQSWLMKFQHQLLAGSETALSMLDGDPFNGEPPRLVRALIYRYRFSSPRDRAESGVWWERQLQGLWSPVQQR